MILDKLLELSKAQAVTDADAYSTNTFDVGNPEVLRRIGDGEPLAIVVVVTTAAAASGAPATFTNTFDFIAVQSANANLSAHDEMVKRRVPAAELTAGAVIVLDIPPGRPTKRHIGARYELGTGDTISVSAYVVPRSFVHQFVAYANGYVV